MASRRKHLVHAQQDLTLQPNQCVVRVLAPKGGNVFEVAFASAQTTMVSLPSRFNKLLYVKRGGYLIVETSPEATGAVTGFVVAVLYDDDVKALRRQGDWCVLGCCAAPHKPLSGHQNSTTSRQTMVMCSAPHATCPLIAAAVMMSCSDSLHSIIHS